MWIKNITDFGRFCNLNIPCLIINITVILLSSSSEEFTHSRKTRKQMFLLVSGTRVFQKKKYLSGAKGMVILKICYASTWEKAIAY